MFKIYMVSFIALRRNALPLSFRIFYEISLTIYMHLSDIL